MAICEKLKELLNRRAVSYEIIPHPVAYTAQEVAEQMHTSGSVVAKAVVLKINSWYAMAVLPAAHEIDLSRLKEALRAAAVRLAEEEEMFELFPDCELGAMPPFGNLYGLPVYFSRQLAYAREIYFNAGTHEEAIRMQVGNYMDLVRPVVLDFSAVEVLYAHA